MILILVKLTSQSTGTVSLLIKIVLSNSILQVHLGGMQFSQLPIHLAHLVHFSQKGGSHAPGAHIGLEHVLHFRHLLQWGYSHDAHIGLVQESQVSQLQWGGTQLRQFPLHLLHLLHLQPSEGSRTHYPSSTHCRHSSQLGPPHLVQKGFSLPLPWRHFLHLPSRHFPQLSSVLYSAQNSSAWTLQLRQSSHRGGVHLSHKWLVQDLHLRQVEQSLMSSSEQYSGITSGSHC